MTITPLEDLTYFATNLTEDTTTTWSNTAGYAIDTVRQYETRLYSSLDVIEPLCEYIYDNTDPSKPHHTTTTLTGVEVADNTAVPCVKDVTIVYVVDNTTYYLFTANSDANVDFTSEDINSPANFTARTVGLDRKEIYQPDLTPLKWADLGHTNKYKCLDQSLSSQTESDNDITMSFVLDKVDEIYLLNLLGDSVTIVATQIDGANEIYNETFQLIDKAGATWYDYFYTDFSLTTRIYKDVPINFNVKFDITITATAGSGAKVGLVGLGRSNYMGGTMYGSSISMIDFSKKQVNTLGETYLEQGNFKSTNNLIVTVESGLTDTVIDKLVNFRATPVIFRSEGFDNFVIFGTYNKWSTLITTPTVTKLTIDLESLI